MKAVVVVEIDLPEEIGDSQRALGDIAKAVGKAMDEAQIIYRHVVHVGIRGKHSQVMEVFESDDTTKGESRS